MTELTVTRQDLEDAAKAAGIEFRYDPISNRFYVDRPLHTTGGHYINVWNPLISGDAFELAFNLDIVVFAKDGYVSFHIATGHVNTILFPANNINEACKAIVLAAAEIWRAKG